jgi:small subunit ribosomal protein S20
VASSSRKVAKGYAALSATIQDVKVESDLKPVDEMLNVAFSNIDKAVSKGVLHLNTGSRRKAKLTNYRKRVLAESGIYTPASA